MVVIVDFVPFAHPQIFKMDVLIVIFERFLKIFVQKKTWRSYKKVSETLKNG